MPKVTAVANNQDRDLDEATPETARATETVAANDRDSAVSAVKPRRRRSLTRPLLFLVVPLALIAGGYVYVTGGQVMETDNAYIGADIVNLSTDVSGIVQEIAVHDNQPVKAGEVLFRLDPKPFQVALDAARAKLGAARNQLLNLKAAYKASLAETAQAKADLPYFQTVYDRQVRLNSTSVASQNTLDEAKHDLEAARQKVAVARAQADQTLAVLGGDADAAIETNPTYLEAKSAVDDAQRELDHTVVKAPFDGIATNVSALQVGSYLPAAQAAFSVVSSEHLWIDANPKETELTYVRPDQPVTITVDAYPGATWTGKVASVSPASASSFSLLPSENSSGNWVKVVQRIPMRIDIDENPDNPPLRVGMSTVVSIETGHARGLPLFVENLLGHENAYAHE
ncbi:HlyD family secretion protein [Rhizobium halophytocola]|uniref:Membrane fusion protein (Multidrug efflux system) n=1 Tax=Rhizobium halophytocola TaxID=735519 RepID=A0ABS4DXD0_9HYPH|nr:HlyD family secretion protein [Rhizobium halophytocola]MBP1850350.1 membrane fusion protein (multidrug efflux system) [Rhizobium halophytocola]